MVGIVAYRVTLNGPTTYSHFVEGLIGNQLMQLSEALIARFQQVYLEEFGEVISPDAAERDLLDLVLLVRITQQVNMGLGDG